MEGQSSSGTPPCQATYSGSPEFWAELEKTLRGCFLRPCPCSCHDNPNYMVDKAGEKRESEQPLEGVGAPDGNEIEVTPAMIAAGVNVMVRRYGDPCFIDGQSAEDLGILVGDILQQSLKQRG